MLAAKRSAGESQERILCRPLPSANKAATLALKLRGDVIRSPKQGYQWPHKKSSITDALQRFLKSLLS